MRLNLQSEINKLDGLREMDRLAIDGLCAELKEMRSLFASDILELKSTDNAK